MNGLSDFINTYKDIIVLFGIIVSLLTFWMFYIPPIRFVWNCLSFEKRFPILNTLKACKDSAWPFKPTIFRKQMRLWLELRLLVPKPTKERKWNPDPKKKRYQWKYDKEEYARELAEWRSEIKDKFASLKIKEREPIIELNNVFQLNDEKTKNGIMEYLIAVSKSKLSINEEISFLCKVKINEGFLLPLNLIAGLMSRFSEDWDPIIASYSQMATKSFSTLQMSIFDLWLLWGPSVPICTCDEWSGPVALQYGFGDENNSVRVYLQEKMEAILLAEFRKSYDTRIKVGYPALHASVIGKLRHASSFIEGAFCGAQKELLNPDGEAFILEYDSHTVIGNASGSHLFYTAYVWAMFVISRNRKPTIEEIRDTPWLQAVPFFEHANIVDETSYESAKLQLAHKVLTFLKNISQLESDPSLPQCKLWYVSAIDDSGCGYQIEVEPKGKRIRTIIEELLKDNEYNGLDQRIVMNDNSFAPILSGCHLPTMISNFVKTIKQNQTNGSVPENEVSARLESRNE